MKLSASEETLHHEDIRQHPSGIIMHMAHGGTDLGARASKVSPAGSVAETLRRKMGGIPALCQSWELNSE